jgi:hypothetical protein
MRTTRVGMALAVLSVAAAWGSPSTGIDGPVLAPAQVTDQPAVLITEVLFAPASGDTAFVELANVSNQPVDLTSMVLRIDTLVLPLPRLASPFGPGSRVLIRFDGRGTVEDNVVHASPGFTLNADGGVVSLLRNDDFVLDRVAWGTAPGAIKPSIGGRRHSTIEPGSTLGRPPGANRPGAATEWVLYPPGQATPGRANPMPPVVQLLPLDGAIFEASPVELSWYPVPGAVRYRIQLSRDTIFSQPLVDQTVSEPTASTGQLPAGTYRWRVQAIGPDGPAAWSRPSQIELSPSGGGGGGNSPGFGPPDNGDPDAAMRAGAVTLNVPYLTQHKDTRMLLLESRQEGTSRTASMLPRVPHTWDGDHGTLDKKDPADNANCAIASMAMINHFYGGDLSQDRISYELFSRNVTKYAGRVNVRSINSPYDVEPLNEQAPGPEFDLNYGTGLTDEQILAEGLFALGTLPGPGSGYLATDAIWRLVVTEINAGRPLLATVPGHVIVIRGYELRGTRRLLYLNDPWFGRYAIDLDAAKRPLGKVEEVLSYPTQPAVARQERSVTADSDGDGVVDFDEIERFHTNPNNRDSDNDGVPDKQDIASGIYELEFGMGYAWNPVPNSYGRDYDRDGIPTELDRDSDNGGCKDGDEDVNGDGVRTGKETGNFDEMDDLCGDLEGSVSYLIDAVNTDSNQIVKHIHDQGVILVRLKPESPGSESYVDNGSTYTYLGFARTEINMGQCVMWGRDEGSGSGPFTGDAQIGATRGNDGTLALGAGAEVTAQSATGGCQLSGGGPTQRRMSFPDCNGMLVKTPAGQPGVPTYRFNCTTRPSLGPGWILTQYYARGFVRVK